MGTIVTIAIISFGMGLLAAFIASQKGRNFTAWWIYGALLFPVAIVHALLLGVDVRAIGGTRKCGFCRTSVSLNATHCPKCGHEFVDLR